MTPPDAEKPLSEEELDALEKLLEDWRGPAPFADPGPRFGDLMQQLPRLLATARSANLAHAKGREEGIAATLAERDMARDILRKTTEAAGEEHHRGRMTLPERMKHLRARCGYLETILRRVRFNHPAQQEPTEQLMAAIDRALKDAPQSGEGE